MHISASLGARVLLMDCGQGVDTQHQRLNETLPAGSCKLPRTQVTQVFLIMNMNVLQKLKAIKECYSRVLLTRVYPAVEFEKTLLELHLSTLHNTVQLPYGFLARTHSLQMLV